MSSVVERSAGYVIGRMFEVEASENFGAGRESVQQESVPRYCSQSIGEIERRIFGRVFMYT